MSSIQPLYILGASGHAREVEAYARALHPDRLIVFVDDAQTGASHINVQEYHTRLRSGEGESVMGSGRCDVRRRMLDEIRPPLATVIHPAAIVMGEVGPGCVVAPGAVVAPHARLENHVMVNYNASVGHDAIVSCLSVIGPGAAVGGWCLLEEAVYVGAGALIREKLKVGAGAIIGMGAVVTKDIPPDLVAVGMPARLKARTEADGGWLK